MNRIRLVDCVGCALLGVVIVLAWPALQVVPVSAVTGGGLFVAGVAEAGLGSFLKARVQSGRIGFGPGRIAPVLVARSVILATASVYAGVFGVGFWAALTVAAFVHRSSLIVAEQNLPGDLIATLCSIALVIGAMWLRKCCRAPQQDPPDIRSGMAAEDEL